MTDSGIADTAKEVALDSADVFPKEVPCLPESVKHIVDRASILRGQGKTGALTFDQVVDALAMADPSVQGCSFPKVSARDRRGSGALLK